MFKEGQLFQARDFVSLLGPCFLLCRFYGIFPYEITSNNREIVHSNWRYICTLIIMLTSSLIIAYVLYHFDFTDSVKYTSVPGLLQGNCYLCLTFLVGFFSMFYINPKLKFLQQLNVISLTFPEKTFIEMSRVIHIKDILGFLFLFAHVPNVYSQDTNQILNKVFALYLTLMVYTMDMLYVDCVYVLYAGFNNVNENLHCLRKYITTEKPHHLRRVYRQYHNPIILTELKTLKEKHHGLSESVQQLNNVFGFHIGTTVVLTFTEVTFSMYFFILWHISDTKFDLKNHIWYWYFMTSMVYYLIKFLVIIFTCEATKNESLRTGNLIHEMLIHIVDFDVKHELQLFSLQLLHRSNTFDARGIVIDATLLKAVVGGIATYLLILIQFLLSSRK